MYIHINMERDYVYSIIDTGHTESTELHRPVQVMSVKADLFFYKLFLVLL